MSPVTLEDLAAAGWWCISRDDECDECGSPSTPGLVSPRGKLVGFYCPSCGTLWAETDADAADLLRWCGAAKRTQP